jgi:hypothetical protein
VGYNQARDQDGELDQRKQRQQVFDLTLKQMKQQQADAEARRALAQESMMSPGAMAVSQNGGPTLAAAQALPTTAPGFDYKRYGAGLAAIGDVNGALAIEQALKKDDVQTVVPKGATLVGGRASGFKVLARGAEDTPDEPGPWREYQLAKTLDGYTGSYAEFKTLGPVAAAAALAPYRQAQVDGLTRTNDYTLPPAPQRQNGVSVTLPNGQVLMFPNQQAADKFKAKAGIK